MGMFTSKLKCEIIQFEYSGKNQIFALVVLFAAVIDQYHQNFIEAQGVIVLQLNGLGTDMRN